MQNQAKSFAILHVHIEKTGRTSVSSGLYEIVKALNTVDISFTDSNFDGLLLSDFVEAFQDRNFDGRNKIVFNFTTATNPVLLQWIEENVSLENSADESLKILHPLLLSLHNPQIERKQIMAQWNGNKHGF
jgi:hypothetical protein